MAKSYSKKEREMDERLAEKLSAMAHPLRLHMVHELVRTGSHNVKSFVDETGISQPAVSQHLSRLRAGGVVQMSKDGTRVYYAVEDDMIRQLIGVLYPNDLSE